PVSTLLSLRPLNPFPHDALPISERWDPLVYDWNLSARRVSKKRARSFANRLPLWSKPESTCLPSKLFAIPTRSAKQSSPLVESPDRQSLRLNSSHQLSSYPLLCI